MKKVLNYTAVFIGTVLICVAALYIAAIIPKDAVKKNSIESAEIVVSHENSVYWLNQKNIYTAIDNYADSILLNIAYNLDNEKPLSSALEAKYYEGKYEGKNEKTIESYKNTVVNDLKPNKPYSRYWHGSIIFLKPLLIFMNLNEIHIFNGICIFVLIMVLEFLLIRKKKIILGISLLTGFFVNSIWVVPFCLEYTPVFIIMLIASIVVLMVREEYYGYVFFTAGLLTCFFDFLTTETITFTIPALIAVSMAYENERFKNLKDGLIYIVKTGLLWVSAYGFMWITKWTFATIVLGRSVFEEAVEKAAVRVGTEGINTQVQNALDNNRFFGNLISLIPINKTTTYGEVLLVLGIIGFLSFSLIYLYGRKIKDYSCFKVIGLLILIPYIRYFVLNNHSTLHAGFTFRAQIITISAGVYMILKKIDDSLIKKDLKKLKRG